MDSSTIASLGIGGPFIAICLIAIKVLYDDVKETRSKSEENAAATARALAEMTDAMKEFSRVAAILLDRRWERQ